MRFEVTEAFEGDYRRLSKRDRELFRRALQDFVAACDAFVADPGSHRWPGKLRVKPVERTSGVFEMTWSFSGPDGRATWEWTEIEVREKRKVKKLPAVRWRRIGDHKILNQP